MLPASSLRLTFALAPSNMSHAQLSRSSSECRIYQNLFRYTSYRQIGGTRTYGCTNFGELVLGRTPRLFSCFRSLTVFCSFMGPYIDKFGMKAAKVSFKSRNYTLYQGYSFPTSVLQSLPKIFSCTWIDDNRIALGCRDGSVRICPHLSMEGPHY